MNEQKKMNLFNRIREHQRILAEETALIEHNLRDIKTGELAAVLRRAAERKKLENQRKQLLSSVLAKTFEVWAMDIYPLIMPFSINRKSRFLAKIGVYLLKNDRKMEQIKYVLQREAKMDRKPAPKEEGSSKGAGS